MTIIIAKVTREEMDSIETVFKFVNIGKPELSTNTTHTIPVYVKRKPNMTIQDIEHLLIYNPNFKYKDLSTYTNEDKKFLGIPLDCFECIEITKKIE